MESEHQLEVAIVGGGIAGLALAIGLQQRNVNFTIYERASSLREIGAGLGFSPNAERAMELLDPRIRQAFKRAATPNEEDYFQWVNGYQTDNVIFRLYIGEQAFQGCRRSDFLEELMPLLLPGKIKFSKELQSVEESTGGRATLIFKDGTSANADVGKNAHECGADSVFELMVL